jgi:tellurite resistance protein
MADSLFEPQEVEAFARGLWMLASVDGEAHEAEQKLIREFIADTGNQITWDQVVADELGPRDIALSLSTSFLRRVFMKAAIALVKADGVYTDEERKLVGEFAEAFGLSHIEFGEIEQAASKARLSLPE